MLKLFKVFTFFVGLLFIFSYSNVYSDSDTEDLEKEIRELEEKLENANQQSKTLANELSYLDTQINLTNSQIVYSEQEIALKKQEIDEIIADIATVESRIEDLEQNIKEQQKTLEDRTRERYKQNFFSNFILFFTSDGLDDYFNAAFYMQQLESHDAKLVSEMDQIRQSYSLQEGLFEQKKEREELLRQELEKEKQNYEYYKSSLDTQKYQKQSLLEQTQNKEEEYQALLEEARRELEQISGAVGVLKNTSGEEVEKGDLIGYQGNTGYSFGEHLHFGIYRYSSFDDIDGWNWYYSNYIDPKKKLESRTVYWHDGCSSPRTINVGNGDWDWPIKNITVSQGFGYTCWSNTFYGGNPHPAYDMYGRYGEPVYAVEDGVAYFCKNCLGDGGNGVFIFHDDDYMTLYWHLR
jgi:peptidoglycan hydrolase CwlO-like protein